MIDTLTLRYSGIRLVALAGEVAGFVTATAATSVARDIDRRLAPAAERASDAVRVHHMVVAAGGGDIVLATSAAVELGQMEETAFYKLPRVMRGGCEPWVRGVVVLAAGDPANPALGVWIGLAALAAAVAGEVGPGEERPR